MTLEEDQSKSIRTGRQMDSCVWTFHQHKLVNPVHLTWTNVIPAGMRDIEARVDAAHKRMLHHHPMGKHTPAFGWQRLALDPVKMQESGMGRKACA